MAVSLSIAVAALSSAAILIRVADAGALAVAFWRTFAGAVVLSPFGLHASRQASVLRGSDYRRLLLSGALLAVHFALWIGSLSLTTVAAAVTLSTASPVFVALGGSWLLDEPAGRRIWTAIVLTLIGVAIIGLGDATGGLPGTGALIGDAMALLSALAMGAYLLVGRSFRRRAVPNTVYTAVVYGTAGVLLLGVSLLTDTKLVGFDTVTWAALAGIVVGPQLLGHTVFNALMGTLTATVISIVEAAIPVAATLMAWLFLDEIPTPWFWFGGPLVLVGVVMAATGAHRASVT